MSWEGRGRDAGCEKTEHSERQRKGIEMQTLVRLASCREQPFLNAIVTSF